MVNRSATLGRAIRNRRKEVGLNQTQTAEILNTTQGTLSRWERDASYPKSPDMIEALSKFLARSYQEVVSLIAVGALVRTQIQLSDHFESFEITFHTATKPESVDG